MKFINDFKYLIEAIVVVCILVGIFLACGSPVTSNSTATANPISDHVIQYSDHVIQYSADGHIIKEWYSKGHAYIVSSNIAFIDKSSGKEVWVTGTIQVTQQ